MLPVAAISRSEPWFFPVLKMKLRPMRFEIQSLCRRLFGHDWVYHPSGRKRLCSKCRRYEEVCAASPSTG